MSNEELKPCPFCGSDAIEVFPHKEDSVIYWDASCGRCGAQTDYFSEERGGKEGAIEAWNTRYERMCKNLYDDTSLIKHNYSVRLFKCSSCQRISMHDDVETFQYCPYCGAKVVENG